jgi:hypothetical protein
LPGALPQIGPGTCGEIATALPAFSCLAVGSATPGDRHGYNILWQYFIKKENAHMKSNVQISARKFGFPLLTLVLALSLAVSAFAAGGKSFTGTVSDAMCGAKHEMAGDAASCTRDCVSKGSKYALVVGDKVYVLETSDKDALTTLNKQAGAKVTVIGTEKDNTITVSSVKAVQ